MAQGYIYKFTIDKKEKKKVEVERKNQKTGEIETILQNKTIKTPVEFIVKKPSRRVIDEAEAQYAIELSKNIKKGIVTKNMMVKNTLIQGVLLRKKKQKTCFVSCKEVTSLLIKFKCCMLRTRIKTKKK